MRRRYLKVGADRLGRSTDTVRRTNGGIGHRMRGPHGLNNTEDRYFSIRTEPNQCEGPEIEE
jgi:hypothetical protein